MPAKKRKAATAAATAMQAQQPAKRVRIGDTSTIGSDSQASTPAPGRPRRSKSSDTPQYNFTRKRASGAADTSGSPANQLESASAAPKRRGRPPKQSLEAQGAKSTSKKGILKNGTATSKSATPPTSAAPKKRGRPAKASVSMPSRMSAATTTGDKDPSLPKRGRPRKITAEEAEVDEEEKEQDYVNGGMNGGEGVKIDENVQYWLMKAEPESRIEKGVDVKFSIDDLAAKTEPEGWDGVRNPVARNNMRAMRAGDLAFFYHSNCKIPGIVGIMRVVEEHQVDGSAFDPHHPYYDPKSIRDKPKWELVKVEYVKKFDTMMTLKELKAFAGKGGILENMQTLQQSRLSVSSVQPAEWQFILEQVGERYDIGHPLTDGDESDTDGEVEQGEDGVDADGVRTSFESENTGDGYDTAKQGSAEADLNPAGGEGPGEDEVDRDEEGVDLSAWTNNKQLQHAASMPPESDVDSQDGV